MLRRRSANKSIKSTSRIKETSLRIETLEERVVLSATAWPSESSATAPAPDISLPAHTNSVEPMSITAPATIGMPVPQSAAPAWILALDFRDFDTVPPDLIHFLTDTQIASIPTDFWFATISDEARARLTSNQVQALNVAALGLKRLTSQQVDWLTTTQIRSIDYNSFQYLSAAKIPLLTTLQVSTIPSTGILNSIPSSVRGAFTASQVRALNTGVLGLSKFTTEQIDFLVAGQIRAVDYTQFQYLTPGKIVALEPSQLATIPSIGWLNAIPSASRAALTPSQVRGLDLSVVGLSKLTTEQISWLLPAQLWRLDYTQFHLLGPDQVVHLLPDQIATIPSLQYFNGIPSATRAALTASQIRGLNVGVVGLSKLTSEQIGFLLAGQIRTVDYTQFQYLTPEKIVALNPAQIATIPNLDWFSGIPSAARAALTASQVRSLHVAELGLSKLTGGQIEWLLPAQIWRLDYTQFQFLSPSRVIHLLPDQLATIPTVQWLNGIPAASRAALTASQVRGLNVAAVGITKLSSEQISWLVPAQLRTIDYTQFHLLGPGQMPLLWPTQIATIPSIEWLDGIPAATRAAMTASQVRSLNIVQLGLSKLTPQQVGWLVPAQVQRIDYTQFQFLTPAQVVHLLPSQVAAIPSLQWLNGIPTATRAALTEPQVQALDIATLGASALTNRQKTFLAPTQVAQLAAHEFVHLTSAQVPHLTKAQMASITGVSILNGMSIAARSALSRAQLLALPYDVQAAYNRLPVDLTAPSDFQNPLTIPPAQDGLAGDMRTMMEKNAILGLVPHAAASHVTASSGNWSNPSTWQGGQVPGLGADVLVSAGHTVTFDTNMTAPIRTVRIDGVLNWATNKDTLMLVDTIITDTFGALHIGTAQQPIAQHATARIVFSAGAIDTSWDPRQISRGLTGRGQVRMYGQEVTPFVGTLAAPRRFDTQLTLDQVPVNWKVGDQIIIAGTNPDASQEELRTILAINGNVVTIDPLNYNHSRPDGQTVHVANSTRNIVLESANPHVIMERGHVMFAHNPDVEVVNAAFHGLGRTDKTVRINSPVVVDGAVEPGTGTNARGRYAVHFHRTGVDPNTAPAILRGSVVMGSPGWGMVNHSSHVLIEENVVYDVVGSGFVTEDGNEIGAFRRNIAIRNTGSGDHILSRTDIHDFGHRGNGFWLQGPGVELVDNVAAGQIYTGFIIFNASSINLFNAVNLDDPSLAGGNDLVPVGSVPFKRVSGNTVYGSRHGLDIWNSQMNMPAGQSFVEDLTTWNLPNAGVELRFTGQITLKDITVIGNVAKEGEAGYEANDSVHDITYDNVYVEQYDVGINAPRRGSSTIIGGHFSAAKAIRIQGAAEPGRTLEIVGIPTFEDVSPEELVGGQQFDIFIQTQDGEPAGNLHTYFEDGPVQIGTVTYLGQQLYHMEQAADFVPFPTASAPASVPQEIVDKSNLELWSEYGIAVGDVVAPADSAAVPRVNGLFGSPTDRPTRLRYVSRVATNQLEGYRLQFLDQYGDTVSDPTTVDLAERWQMFTRQVDGQTRTFFVLGDTEAPTYVPDPDRPSKINPNALGLGLDLFGFVVDNSFGQKRIVVEFRHLKQRPILTRPDGSQYMLLNFTISDLAGNTTPVEIELDIDETFPIVDPFEIASLDHQSN